MKILYVFVGLIIGVLIGFCIWGNIGARLSSAKCLDGMRPDVNGCCAGEVYTDMGEMGFNCCPSDGDCFPPIK